MDAKTTRENTPVDHLCRLCSTPIPWVRRKQNPKETSLYCCSGCLHVAQILAVVSPEQGRKIFDQARVLGIVPNADSLSEGSPGIENRAADPDRLEVVEEKTQHTERYVLEGIACPSCAWLVDAVMLNLEGVIDSRTDFMSDSVVVTYDMRRLGPHDLAEALHPFGYRMLPVREGSTPEEAHMSHLLRQFLLALFLTLNVMMLSAVHWFSFLEVVPNLDLKIIALVQLALTVALMGFGVRPLLVRGMKLLRLGRPSMDILYVMGFFSAFFLSVTGFFVGQGAFYFDTCCAFLTISMFGRVVEAKLRHRAVKKLRSLWDVPAVKVEVLGSQGDVFRPIDQVLVGDEIIVRSGQSVPFDGICMDASVVVSEAVLSGESTPLVKKAGDTIWAGSRPMDQAIRIRVSRPFRLGRLQQIAECVARSLGQSEIRLRSADRLAGWFVPGVLLLAVLTLTARLWHMRFADFLDPEAWMPAVSVLLVACPCAFGIASASVLAVAVSKLLEKGVLITDSSVLERLETVDTVVLDKTGTLTAGDWNVQEVRWFQVPNDDVLKIVAGMESGIDHPVALCLREYICRGLEIEPMTPEGIENVAGRGVRAMHAGRQFCVGSAELFESVADLGYVDELVSLVYFGNSRCAEGVFLLTDTLRRDALPMISFFRKLGMRIEVLSGDRQSVVDGVARRLDIEKAQGGFSPEQKQAEIRRLAGLYRQVCYIGDGSNDGPAMAESQVAISVRKGTNISMTAAHIILLVDRLDCVSSIFASGRITRKVMRWNFVWAFFYNLLFLPLAALGFLHPVAAAGLMFVSSITVLINSLRLGSRVEKIWSAI